MPRKRKHYSYGVTAPDGTVHVLKSRFCPRGVTEGMPVDVHIVGGKIVAVRPRHEKPPADQTHTLADWWKANRHPKDRESS